jgi:predicted transglutaminase-like cysteine proteinase
MVYKLVFYVSSHVALNYLKLFTSSILISIYLLSPAVLQADHVQLLPQMQLKHIQDNFDKETSNRFNAWDTLLKNSKNKSTIDKLHLVNDFFNQMKWVDDQELWNAKDYWATPIESLIRNAGDCEDYSIAKYFTLLELGVDVKKLKISYVKIIDFHQSHIILAYYQTPQSDPLILDNMKSDILKSSERTNLKIKYEFNDEGLWSHNNPQIRMGTVTKIRHWANMVQRMEAE